MPGEGVHAFNPSTWKIRGLSGFKTSLVYKTGFRIARAVKWRYPVSTSPPPNEFRY